MKKLLTFAFAAALVAPVFADEATDEPEIKTEEIDVKADVKARETALWPVFFALGELPETPDLVGLRLTIPYSTKQESVSGLDLGLWARSKDFEGIQINVFRSDVKDVFAGLQISCYNSVNRADLGGVQIGLWNQSNSFRGLQIGLINVTGEAQGFQFGLINRAETMYGWQVGVINIIRDAEVPVLPLVNIGF